ncbi:MAG: dihydroneopterin aldolase [Myxococcaceae bacterium]|nr:dihydroneopterin aldolase [Myxococcaceae bacterium]
MAEKQGRYQLFLEDVRLMVRVGVYAKEKKRAQELRLNVTVDVTRDAASDRLRDVYSYEDVMELLRDACTGSHVDLLETLADRIFERLFEEPRVLGATVRIAKPHIFREAGAAGIVVQRGRP